MKKIIVFFIFLNFFIYSDDSFKIDWAEGRIYSYASVKVKSDKNFMNDRIIGVENAKEETKAGFYKALDTVYIFESTTVLDYFEEHSDKNRELYSLINNAKFFKMEYPDLTTIKVTYVIPIFGENSLMSLMISERNIYTEELKSYLFYPYKAEYTGIIIDARGELTSYDGYKVKAKPALFISVKDEDGKVVFDQYNVLPDVIKRKGMALYSYSVMDDFSGRIGSNPLKIAALGTGDRTGSVLTVSLDNAKKMVSSDILKNAIKNGSIVIIVNQ